MDRRDLPAARRRRHGAENAENGNGENGKPQRHKGHKGRMNGGQRLEVGPACRDGEKEGLTGTFAPE